jgi:glutathione S-transferase
MSLTLHYHPLASFCWKALTALYENDIPFTPNSVNLGNADERAALLKLWPIGKFPVLRDDARGPGRTTSPAMTEIESFSSC